MGMNEEKGDPVNHPAHYPPTTRATRPASSALTSPDTTISALHRELHQVHLEGRAEEVGGDVRQGEGAGGPRT